MTPERWEQVNQVLGKALELSTTERSVYLAEIATSDPELQLEVESLLVSHEKAGTKFLNTPAVQTVADLGNLNRRDEMLGRRLGAYEVVGLIDAGGMGEVFRGFRADDQYRKQVALKLIRAGQDSGFVIDRFKNERQILASLDHSNIARLLDGGTSEEGAPYFVMELIEGESIDKYCRTHELNIAARLTLFLQVCSAVHYAHQRLIVHRDLKPSNILVTSDGTPKLLDFGIAKILDPEMASENSESTLTQFRVLTPAYASPEQIKGEPISTASDVYSLGMVLYELLTGSSPYGTTARTHHELAQAACELEPEKPSTVIRRTHRSRSGLQSEPGSPPDAGDAYFKKLGRRLEGDLDNIVLMALRKEPQRRYSSVEQFTEDIRRHLENLPVIARRDTAGYRATKFIARHKAGVAATAAVAIILVAALLVTFREAHIARQQAELAREQRARAERRFNDVRKLANSLIFEVHDSIKNSGATEGRRLLVSRALEYLDSLSREANGDPSLQRELAAAYDRVGDVLGDTSAANLADFAGASQSYAKALAIREALAAASPTDLGVQTELADEYFRAASVLQNTGDFAASLKTLQRAGPFMQRIAEGKNDPKLQERIAGLYYYTGSALEKSRDFSRALESYRTAVSIQEPIAADPKASGFSRAHLVADYNGVARMLVQGGQIDEAIATTAKALGIMKQLSEADPGNKTFREWLAESYGVSADVQMEKGHLEQALEFVRRAQEIFKQLSAADPSDRLAMSNLAFQDLTIGQILVRQGNVTGGLQNIHAAFALVTRIGEPKNLWDLTLLSLSYSELGMASAALAEHAVTVGDKTRDWQEARSWYQKALDVWGDKAKYGAVDALGRNQAAEISQELAKCDANLRALKARP